ncbi:hypothetical protein ONS95_008572 [Cadophora gregata]|uniref:uncharacterized protein n=1 Tax=Cadophora gregata TaxID=51156 RepID=UPI0026DC8269|nr:uncharacterized protein ONS95_008572 [Cadophora gregata]KAK0099818.1 hypothetical protein ONS95_008572 [Cadophora gregata]KAK0123581.1 hypothetical protein ONS96_010559 [Cadophora gregata f. sp. sojae]
MKSIRHVPETTINVFISNNELLLSNRKYRIRYVNRKGDLEKFKERGLLGAMTVTEGLLKRARGRWTMAKVAEEEWVRGGIEIEIHGSRQASGHAVHVSSFSPDLTTRPDRYRFCTLPGLPDCDCL